MLRATDIFAAFGADSTNRSILKERILLDFLELINASPIL